jgi:hypothetical protein
MFNRLSNIALLVLCGLLVVGIIVTRRLDTAIEWKVEAQNQNRAVTRDDNINCADTIYQLIDVDTANWQRVEYILPSFSSYNLEKRSGAWYLDTLPTDALATAQYMGKIAGAKWSCTVYHANPEALKMADYVLKIVTTNAETLSYKAFVVDTNYIIQDHNGRLYPGNIDSLFWQLYFGKHRFIPSLSQQ